MTYFKCTLIAALIASAGAVLAHGSEDHKKAPAAVKKEQKEWGIAGEPGTVKRIVKISMHDSMRFSPDKLTVKSGETIRFVFRNEGKQMHEFVLGTKKELDEHAALMLKFPDMEHDEPYMAHVGPGKTEEIIWTFNKAGQFEFACLIPGHYQAGMVGKVSVATSGKADHQATQRH